MVQKHPAAKRARLEKEWNLLGEANPKKGRIRSIFSRDMWFLLMILLILVAIFVPDHRLNFLMAALFSTLGLAWIQYRESRVRKKVKRFREEMIYVKSVEAVNDLHKVKSELQKLLGKYRDIPEFSEFIKSALGEIEIKIHHLPRNDVMMERAPEPGTKPDQPVEAEKKERRKHRRVNIQIVLNDVINFNADSEQNKCRGAIVDLSPDGALIRTESKMDVKLGDVVSINQLEIDGTLRFEAVFGKVCHFRDAKGERAFGVEFVYLEDSEKEKLDKYLVGILT